MSSPKEEQERVKSLLLDTVTLLCKNGLTFKKHLKVEGLLGITLDEENVFIVHFNENCGEVTVEVTNEDNGASKTVNARRNSSEHKSQKRKKRKSSSDYREPPEKIQLKTESDVIFLENDEDEDVKPFASQNFVPYQNSSTVFPNYGPIPMTPTQHLSPMIGLNNSVGQFTPGGVIGSAAQLPGPHTGMPNFSQDSSSLTTQMTPEKMLHGKSYPGSISDFLLSPDFFASLAASSSMDTASMNKNRNAALRNLLSEWDDKCLDDMDSSRKISNVLPTPGTGDTCVANLHGDNSDVGTSENLESVGAYSMKDLSPGKFECEHCSRMYKTRDNLVRHAKSHLYPNRPRCAKCTLYFPDETALRRHNLENHYQNYHCHLCFFKTKRRKVFVYHMSSVHGAPADEVPLHYAGEGILLKDDAVLEHLNDDSIMKDVESSESFSSQSQLVCEDIENVSECL